MKTKLTNSLVLSYFVSGLAMFCTGGPYVDKLHINEIQKVQMKCLRYIYGTRTFDTVSHKLQDAGWLSVSSGQKLHSLNLYDWVIYHNGPTYLSKRITYRTDVNTLNLRFFGLLSPPPHKTVLFEEHFQYMFL